MELRGIPFASEIEAEVRYGGIVVGRHRLDLVASGGIVVELKAVQSLGPVHFSQVRSYLKATHLSIGLLLNFAATRLVIKRVILPEDTMRAHSGLPSLQAFPRLPVHRAKSDPPRASAG
jgi:GxxExxY protein